LGLDIRLLPRSELDPPTHADSAENQVNFLQRIKYENARTKTLRKMNVIEPASLGDLWRGSGQTSTLEPWGKELEIRFPAAVFRIKTTSPSVPVVGMLANGAEPWLMAPFYKV
jgi:hypothetical protein